MKLTWKKRGERIYFGYDLDGDDSTMIFGAPAPANMWCWVVWLEGRQTAGFANSFAAAKRAAGRALEGTIG